MDVIVSVIKVPDDTMEVNVETSPCTVVSVLVVSYLTAVVAVVLV